MNRYEVHYTVSKVTMVIAPTLEDAKDMIEEVEGIHTDVMNLEINDIYDTKWRGNDE